MPLVAIEKEMITGIFASFCYNKDKSFIFNNKCEIVEKSKKGKGMAMVRLIRGMFLLVLFGFIGYYLLINNFIPEKTMDDLSNLFKEKKITLEKKEKQPIEHANRVLEDDFLMWIGKSTDELVSALGEPVRKDLSAYEYTWWVYTDQKKEYIQFGIHNNEIQTVYVTGESLPLNFIEKEQAYEDISEQYIFEEEINYRNGLSYYTFHLTPDDLIQRPLVKVTDHVFIQFYFDRITNDLSSIRILTADVLLQHTPYEIEYRGKLPEKPIRSDKEWAKVERGMEQQIFDITNVIRNGFQKSKLTWEEDVRDVAFEHSKDMAKNDFFSHVGLDGTGLKERLATTNILYQSAGENIAAQYPDAPATLTGWLNSEGHREALLEEEFTHLGVGVYRFYYTQNFISKTN